MRVAGRASADPGTGANTAPTDEPASVPDRIALRVLGVNAIGGVLAVAVGVIALALIACVAVAVRNSTTTPIVTGCVSAIGSVVVADFDVAVGTDGTSTAIAAHQ
jgi:hypothetical protein